MLRALLGNVPPYDRHPYLHDGMMVEVIEGPIHGIHGILLRKEQRHGLVLGVHLTQKAAEIDVHVVRPG